MMNRKIKLIAFFLAAFCSELSAQTFYGMTRTGGTAGGGTIFKANADGSGLSTEYNFPIEGQAGRNSDFCQMVKFANGKLYGVMPNGGKTDSGVLFEYDPATNTYTKKIDFDLSGTGWNPFGKLELASNGKLYGMTSGGGINYGGTIFEYDPAANTLTKKFDFNWNVDGGLPYAGVTLVNNKLYGVTSYGGVNDKGVLFEFDPLTNTYTKKYDFDGPQGSLPLRDLALSTITNKLYGMTVAGGVNSMGVIFEYDQVTGTYTKKVDFDGTNGAAPVGSFVEGANGKLYATTSAGGLNNLGVLIEYDPSNGAVVKKFDFNGTANGQGGNNIMVRIANGKLYGTTELGGAIDGGVLFEFDPATGAYSKKFDFDGFARGYGGKSGLTLANNNKLYGTTASGGQFDAGVLFEFDPATSIYTKKLDMNGAANGNYPENSLVQASNGKLYGTTPDGGTFGWGVLFEFDPFTMTFTKNVDFDNDIAKGTDPYGGLSIHTNGKIYGMTSGGGLTYDGILFEFDPGTGLYTKKIDFDGASKGRLPYGGLMLATNGKFYGMTTAGGASDLGVLFEYDAVLNSLSKKVDFTGINGQSPYGNLVTASNGKYYGMTEVGGTGGFGVIFEYDPALNIYSKTHDFTGALLGQYPYGSLVAADDGMLYGMTSSGGTLNEGILFQFNPATGLFTKKTDFDYNGGTPLGSMVKSVNGNLYGVTAWGGAEGFGILFEYNPATSVLTRKTDFVGTNGARPGYGSLAIAVFPPAITSFSPLSGNVGSNVTITGANFSTVPGNNTVMFNGTAATVTASTATSITTSVPVGAITGKITVTVASQTATSTIDFTVTTATAPTLSGFNPTSGPIGTSVTLTGTNFDTTPANNTVTFNSTTATVTASTATNITTSVPVGATTGKITVTVASQTATSAIDFTVTTATAPTLSGFNPTSGPVGTTVTLTGTNFDTTPANNTVKFNSISATVTASTATSITTTVPSGATSGPITVTVGGQTATSSTNFTVAIDTTPPTLTTDNTPTSIASGSPVLISVVLTDLESPITAASVSYRSVSAGGTASVGTLTKGTTDYTFSIPSTAVGDIGVEYKITATSAGGTFTSPAYRTVRVNSASGGVTIPYANYGNAQSNYRIIAVPMDLTAKTVTDILVDDLGTYDQKKWRVSHYDNGTNTELSVTSTLDAGLGYWLIIKDGPKTINTGAGTTVLTSSDAPFEISLKSGWNQIGNPYNFNLLWSEVQEANSGLPGLRTFKSENPQGGDYPWGDGLKLNAMEGGFVNVPAGRQMKFPVVKNPAAGRTMEETIPFRNSLDQKDWQVYLTLRQDNLVNRISGFGMHEEAASGFDAYDGLTMPRFFDRYVEVNHLKRDVNGTFSKDVVPIAGSHTWEFEVESSEEQPLMALTWDNSYFGNNDMALILWDNARQLGIDMRATTQYAFDKAVSRSFKVFYGFSAEVHEKAVVKELVVHSVSPNPAGGEVKICFSTGEDGAVSFETVDLMGRRVWSLEKTYSKGYHEEVWGHEQGKESPGIYIVQVKNEKAIWQQRIYLN